MQNINSEDYDQRDQSEIIIEQLHKKIGKLSKQYLNLVKEVKKSDYMRGYNTSVSYAHLKELESIRDKFDSMSNSESVADGDFIKKVKSTIEEIEDVLTQNGNSYSINSIIEYVKEKVYQLYIQNREELEYGQRTPINGHNKLSSNKTADFDDVKGKLDFQNAMDDLTKNYTWLKEKAFKSLEGLDLKYQQIQTDLYEMNQRLKSYRILETFGQKKHRNIGKRDTHMSENEKQAMLDVFEDIFGQVGYTTDSVQVLLDSSNEDIDVLKDTITEYHELLEDKIKKLPNIISSSNLKTATKNLKGEELYDLYLADPEKSEKSNESRNETSIEKELKKDLKKLQSQVSHWKKGHKQLFDVTNEHLKIYSKMMKNKNMERDSLKTCRELFSKSTIKLKDLLRNQYELHYNKNKSRSHREHNSELKASLSPSREFKSSSALNAQRMNETNQFNEDLSNKVIQLKNQVAELQKDLDRYKSKNSLLKQEYEEIDTKYEQINIQLSSKEKSISELKKDNSKLNQKFSTLRGENETLEDLLDQNRNANVQGTSEFKNIIKKAKNSCEAQITSVEKQLEASVESLEQQVRLKDNQIRTIDGKLNDFKFTTLPKLQSEASQKLSKQMSEIQSLHSKNKELNSTVDELTETHQQTEKKLQKSQKLANEFKAKLQEAEQEEINIRKVSEEQENNAASLYESRLDDKNQEIEVLHKDVNKKDAEILALKQDSIKFENKLGTIEAKVKSVQSLIDNYDKELEQESGSKNQTVKLISDELKAVLPNDDRSITQSDDKLNQIRELLKDKNQLENQVKQLKWDIEHESHLVKQSEQDKSTLQEKLEDLKKAHTKEIQDKTSKINSFETTLEEKDAKIATSDGKIAKLDKLVEGGKQRVLKLENNISRYTQFTNTLFNSFDYHHAIEDDQGNLEFEGFFKHLARQNNKRDEIIKKAESEVHKLRENLNKKTQDEQKEAAIKTTNETINQRK